MDRVGEDAGCCRGGSDRRPTRNNCTGVACTRFAFRVVPAFGNEAIVAAVAGSSPRRWPWMGRWRRPWMGRVGDLETVRPGESGLTEEMEEADRDLQRSREGWSRLLTVGSKKMRRSGFAIRGTTSSTNHNTSFPSRWIATSAPSIHDGPNGAYELKI